MEDMKPRVFSMDSLPRIVTAIDRQNQPIVHANDGPGKRKKRAGQSPRPLLSHQPL